MGRSRDNPREYYRRHLPHQIPRGVPIFVTWNLKGSLPDAARRELEQERERLERQPPRADETRDARKRRIDKILFAKRDRILDNAESGPLWLKDPEAAQLVVDRVLYGATVQPEEGGKGSAEGVRLKPDVRYELFAYCVMANHVHVLLKSKWGLKDVMQGIKGYTSFRINQLQNATGRTFWQDESYDHWCRDEEELFRIIEYIERNPVAAGLCDKPADWPWSSARWRATWKAGEAFRMEFLPPEEQERLRQSWRSK